MMDTCFQPPSCSAGGCIGSLHDTAATIREDMLRRDVSPDPQDRDVFLSLASFCKSCSNTSTRALLSRWSVVKIPRLQQVLT